MTPSSYTDFLAQKEILDPPTGIAAPAAIAPHLFPFQADIVRWALRRGRAALFADCGMGKTPMQLEWARQVVAHTGGKVLILTPLAVSQQTIREAHKFGVRASYAKHADHMMDAITVTNYERIESFNPSDFAGVVCDESSILKSYSGSTSTAIIEAFSQTPFRLACTATPAPNDYMELGTHAEFVGAMSRPEMLAMFFVHDGGETQKWRIRGHGQSDFWKWLASWAVLIRKPSDLGYSDEGFTLPPLNIHQHTVASEASDGMLFAVEAQTLQERITARRASIPERASQCAAIVNATPGPWVVWCNLNAEADALKKRIPDAVEVRGSDDADEKEHTLMAFSDAKFRVIITKPSIAGFGMNWQHCAQMAFVGLSDSWEQYYQAVRRSWRFGQTLPVDVHIISAESEGAVVANIKRKDKDAEAMAGEMVEHMRDLNSGAIHGETTRVRSAEHRTRRTNTEGTWEMRLGDCVDELRTLPDASIDFSVFSPPFASLYTYSNSDRDMGNCADTDTFYQHFGYAVKELRRVIKPGRLVSFHCMNLPTSKVRDGVIGLRDFRGELIRLFESKGFIYHSEVCIWKDPVTAMQRTKALGLLHKTIRNDSAMSRQGIPDYLVTMRVPGENTAPIAHTKDEFPVMLWQRFASPIWMDIDPQDTLEYRSARENDDERHICPLQLQVIRRALMLWSNPGDVVLSPFGGIGSEGVVALEEGRRYLGIELKESYYMRACKHLDQAVDRRDSDLFSIPMSVGR
jgi:DNA modification methylase